jgi:Co/Zn/Cd efflux system component
VASFFSGSTALLADSLDFFSDGVNYFSSLFALKKGKKTHDKLGKIKGYYMFIMGIIILVWSVFKYFYGWIPHGGTMSVIGFFALTVNLLSSFLLVKFQNRSLDLQAVWLCTRNDALGNILIIIAGYATVYFSSALPDIAVSLFMGILILKSGLLIIQKGEDHGHQH